MVIHRVAAPARRAALVLLPRQVHHDLSARLAAIQLHPRPGGRVLRERRPKALDAVHFLHERGVAREVLEARLDDGEGDAAQALVAFGGALEDERDDLREVRVAPPLLVDGVVHEGAPGLFLQLRHLVLLGDAVQADGVRHAAARVAADQVAVDHRGLLHPRRVEVAEEAVDEDRLVVVQRDDAGALEKSGALVDVLC